MEQSGCARGAAQGGATGRSCGARVGRGGWGTGATVESNPFGFSLGRRDEQNWASVESVGGFWRFLRMRCWVDRGYPPAD